MGTFDYSYYLDACKSDFDGVVKIAINKVENYRGSYIFGMLMSYAKDCGIAQAKGFKNIYDYADKAYKVSKSQVARSVQVYTEYRQGLEVFEDIDIRYNEFTFSQLVEMMAVPKEQRHLVKVSMTIIEIRALVKSLIAESEESEESELVATSQLEETGQTNEEYIKSLSGKALVRMLDRGVDCVPHLLGKYVGCECPYKVCSVCISKVLAMNYEAIDATDVED